jgi:hypothetical protein
LSNEEKKRLEAEKKRNYWHTHSEYRKKRNVQRNIQLKKKYHSNEAYRKQVSDYNRTYYLKHKSLILKNKKERLQRKNLVNRDKT